MRAKCAPFWIVSKAVHVIDYYFRRGFQELQVYFGRQNALYYALNELVIKSELFQDDTLFVELKDGTRFYGLRSKIVHPSMKYVDHRKMNKIKTPKHFSDFLGSLCQQYVESLYEKAPLRKGDTVIDAGAWIGTFTVKAAKAIGDEGRVIAIEPERSNIELLRKNVEANGLGNVIIVHKGIWSKRDKLRFHLSGVTAHSFVGGGTDEFVEVEVDSLDNMLRELGIEGVDFIKMDIEGAEIEALKGMEKTLKDNDVKLAIAAYHLVNGKKTYRTIVPELEHRGFRVLAGGSRLEARPIIYASKG
jgi:FkbM family methyltransferase